MLTPIQPVLAVTVANGAASSAAVVSPVNFSEAIDQFHLASTEDERHRLLQILSGLAREKMEERKAGFSNGLHIRHGIVIRLKMAGFGFKTIGSVLGVSGQRAHQIFGKVRPHLHPKTFCRMRPKEGARPDIERRQTVVAVFFEELNARPLPAGVIVRTAKRVWMSYGVARRFLKRGGIHTTAEIARRRFDFILAVAATIEEPFHSTREKLQVEKTTLIRYRKMVREGRHLQGPIELVESPEAQQWWDIRLPGISEGTPVGKGRVNLLVRNETVRKDLDLFDRAMEEARKRMRFWHPDAQRNWGNPKALRHFQNTNTQWQKLRAAKERYRVKEREWRRKLGLPLFVDLE